MKNKTLIGLFALMVVGIVFSASMVSAYRGDYSVSGPEFTEERHEAIENAFETLDYNTWYELMTENGRQSRVTELVTEDNFAIFVQAHEAAESGDYESAAALRTELGLNNGVGPRDGAGFKAGQGKKGQRMQQANFIDADKDGNCDNLGLRQGRGQVQ
jgi:hypothetical protein